MFESIFQILTSPPGSLLYHLTLVFSVALTSQVVLTCIPRGQYRQNWRLLLGLGSLLLGQVLLFAAGLIAGRDAPSAHAALPPLDRLVIFFGLLAVVWLWVFPRSARMSDIGTAALAVSALMLFAINQLTWGRAGLEVPYNSTTFDMVWALLCLVLSLAGLALLGLRRQGNWGVGVAMMALNIIGFSVQAFAPQSQADFSAPVRLVQLCAFPLLPFLAQGAVKASQPLAQPAPPPPAPAAPPPAPEARAERRPTSPVVENAWMELFHQDERSQAYISAAHAVAVSMQSDICLLVSTPNSQGDLIIHGGYDLREELDFPRVAIYKDRLPGITAAIEQGMPLELKGDDPELLALGEALAIAHPGSLLMAPLIAPERMWGGVILLSPYSRRAWTRQDQAYLTGMVKNLVRILESFEQNLPDLGRKPEPAAQPQAFPPVAPLPPQEDGEEPAVDVNALLGEILGSQPAAPSEPVALDPGLEALPEPEVDVNDLLNSLMSGGGVEVAPAPAPAPSAAPSGKTALTQDDLDALMAEMDAPAPAAPPVKPAKPAGGAASQGDVDALLNSLMSGGGVEVAPAPAPAPPAHKPSGGSVSQDDLDALLNSLMSGEGMQPDPAPAAAPAKPAGGAASPRGVGDVIDEAVSAVRQSLGARNIALQVELPDSIPEPDCNPDDLLFTLVSMLNEAETSAKPGGAISLRVFAGPDLSGQPSVHFQVQGNTLTFPARGGKK